MSTKQWAFLQGMNIVVFVVTVAVNGLAGGTTLLNGKTSGEISDLYPTLITPAGFTFSIWSLIYTLLLVFVVFQALPRNRDQAFIRQVSFLFILSGVWNVLWLFLWHYELLTFSVVLMFALLATLIAIYLRLGIGKGDVRLTEKLCVHVPFSVYLGWITVASITNVAAALTAVGWDGGGIEGVTWGILVIAVALVITLAVVGTRKDAAYGLVLVWALAGIVAKQIEHPTIVLAAEVSIAIILIAIVGMAVFSRLKR
ncbi:MAG: tryptophan-rich sensory protein [Candidatus Bathyarchaeota archaeon]|nr:tryptophan-rich sensory protein [Candidatus Bathyarchaeota archaeon]